MSGDSMGVVVGGVVAIAALPYIVGTAMVAGAAYAAIKGSMFAYRFYKNRKVETQHASAHVRSATQAMQQRIDRQQAEANAARRAHAERVSSRANELQQMTQNPRANTHALLVAREALDSENAGEALRQQREKLRCEAERDMAEIIRQAAEVARTQQMLVDWQRNDQASRRAQEKAAAQVVLDAHQTLDMLSKLDDAGDPSFGERMRVLGQQVREAERCWTQGAYQRACTVAQAAINDCLTQAAEQAQLCLEADELRNDLLSQLEVMRQEMQENHFVSFAVSDAVAPETVGLTQFAQGHWEEVETALESVVQQVQSASMAELQMLEQQLHQSIRPKARRLMHAAADQMLLYYEKLYAARNVVSTMRDNNFTCVKVVQPQGDKTQELALQFADPSGAQLVVSLDADLARGMDEMRLGLHVVPTEGRQPSEAELACIRGHLVDGLQEEGAEAELHCSGNVNRSTSLVKYADLQQLENAPAVLRTQV